MEAVRQSAARPVAASRKGNPLRKLWKFRALIILALPGLALLLINNYLPMFGVFLAFKDFNYAKGIIGSDWNGFDNFHFLFATSDMWHVIVHTIVYNLAFLLINTVLSVLLALLLNEVRHRFLSKFYQSTMLLPHFISMVVVAYLVYGFLNPELGFINKSILEPAGKEGISWYMSPQYWPYILTVVNIWKSVGFGSVIYLATIVGIDREYYEAAMLDGASKWKQMTKITLPFLIPVIIILTLLAIGRIFSADFGLFYQVTMNAGMLKSTTDVIDTYVYNALLVTGDTNLASAAGLLQAVVGFVLIVSVNMIVKRVSSDNSLF
ncbi:putative aldouronate transport system permease protein [Paenibacillus taihuensis]|uniref:Putative aldouronate transport system permease protein n=1 Tax=Paenibacillus taihuensis TaxID=1156355 RepID=A0A3D9R3K0_9BACL|nr:ABC transporter permease subunit [Paenibacillus taihuensis]REE67651.1 putative aldouronate transport system permease protein [Paenibacillus taihuensis]